MKSEQRPTRAELVAVLSGLLSSSAVAVATLASSSRTLITIVIAMSLGFAATIAYYFLSASRRLPTSLSIMLVGPPGVGKTVYLTILFRELETGRLSPLLFAPSGPTTTVEVARNVALMASGHFPEKTLVGPPFLYEAVARLGKILPRKYRIRIGDFAGEYLFSRMTDELFRNTEFFDYLVSADAVIFMIDCETLLSDSEEEHTAYLESGLIATLNTLIEHRNDDPMQPLRIPVALLFSKADLVWMPNGPGEEEVVARLANFIAVCSRRCRRFSYFFVSALGVPPDIPGVPPRRLTPLGIVEPLKWILRE